MLCRGCGLRQTKNAAVELGTAKPKQHDPVGCCGLGRRGVSHTTRQYSSKVPWYVAMSSSASVDNLHFAVPYAAPRRSPKSNADRWWTSSHYRSANWSERSCWCWHAPAHSSASRNPSSNQSKTSANRVLNQQNRFCLPSTPLGKAKHKPLALHIVSAETYLTLTQQESFFQRLRCSLRVHWRAKHKNLKGLNRCAHSKHPGTLSLLNVWGATAFLLIRRFDFERGCPRRTSRFAPRARETAYTDLLHNSFNDDTRAQ